MSLVEAIQGPADAVTFAHHDREDQRSTDTQEPVEMATKPIQEHKWLQHFIGEWRVENEMTMSPDQPKMKSEGRETVKDLGGLWAVAQGESGMPNGESMTYDAVLGYDVLFKEYRDAGSPRSPPICGSRPANSAQTGRS